MNRDEALSRLPENTPEVTRGSVSTWIAPSDGDRGGTWAGVNTHGVVACLLNAYLPGESLLPDTTGRFRSRGEIIPSILERGPLEQGLEWFENELVPVDYPSFTLILGDLERRIELSWLREGGVLSTPLEGRWNLWSSSGWDSREVIAWREKRFAQWRAEGELYTDTLPAFHLICEAGHEERSPLMRRSWSGTRSITQLRVDGEAGNVELRYWPDPQPESTAPAVHIEEPLADEWSREPADTRTA